MLLRRIDYGLVENVFPFHPMKVQLAIDKDTLAMSINLADYYLAAIESYGSQHSNEIFEQNDYTLGWMLKFSDLINDPQSVGDDVWDFLYPQMPFIPQSKTLLCNESSTKVFDNPRRGHQQPCAKLVIRPNAESFDDCYFFLYMHSDAELITNQAPIDEKDWVGLGSVNKSLELHPSIRSDSPWGYELSWPVIKRSVVVRLSCSHGQTVPEYQLMNPGETCYFIVKPEQGEKSVKLYYGTKYHIVGTLDVELT